MKETIEHIRKNSLPYLAARALPDEFATASSMVKGKPVLSPKRWRAFLKDVLKTLTKEERLAVERLLLQLRSAQPAKTKDGRTLRVPPLLAGSDEVAIEILFALLAALDDELGAEIQSIKEVLYATLDS